MKVGTLFVLVLIGAGMWLYTQARWEAQCLAAGYPQVRWSPLAGVYCIKREGYSDVVVPLAQVRP